MTKSECIKEFKEHNIIISISPYSDGVHRCSRCGEKDRDQHIAWPGFKHPQYGKGGIKV